MGARPSTLCIGLFMSLGWAAALSAQAPRFADVRALITREMASGNPPGLALAVMHGDSLIWEEGFGLANQELQVRATPHTPFQLASVTKAMIGAAAMILERTGRLQLDHPANQYLGSAKIWSPRWDVTQATVRRLANHTGGLSTFDLSCATGHPDCRMPTTDEMIERYGVVVWPPDEQFDYSNLGYHLFGEIVARAAGRDLGVFLRDELFRPLGMTDASLGVDSMRLRETAVPYGWVRGAVPLVPGATGSSSIYASAHDLVLFGAMVAKIRRPGVRAPIPDASIDAIPDSAVSTGGSAKYSLGWSIQNDRFGYRSILSQGGTDAAQAWLRIIPSEQIVVAVVSNKGVGLNEAVIDAVIGELLPRYAAAQAAAKARAGPTEPAQSSPVRLGATFAGAWQGAIRMERGDFPIALDISADGTVRATLAGNETRVGRARASDNFLVRFPGGLDTPDTTSGRRVSLYLRARGALLNGVATTAPPVSSGLAGQVSYWVELRRR